MDVSTLKTDGFVSLTYPPQLRAPVHNAMQSWRTFCDLPQESKDILADGNRIHDFGYMRRNDTGDRSDNKELFHLVGRDLPLLYEKSEYIKDVRAIHFIRAIDSLLHATGPLIREFACKVEQQYNLHGFEQQVMKSQDNWTFRYLHYFGGDILAHAHADRGGFTFHLQESAGGGEYLDFGHVWRPWLVNEDQTIIFPGLGLQYRSEGVLKALYHRVQATPETTCKGRYSMVLFIDFKQDHRFNKEVYRVQDLPEGFNYDMPFSEFAEFFVPRT